MKRKLSFLVVLCLILSSLASFALADSGVIKTPSSDGSVNIRAAAGVGNAVVGWAKNGTAIEILHYGNTWHKIKVTATGKTGWVYAKYIKATSSGSSSSSSDSSAVSGTVAAVTTRYADSVVNLRAGAGTGYAVVGGVKRGTRLSVISTQDNWYQVYVPSKGVTAWISKTYASLGLAAKATGDVNLRTGAGTGYSRIDVIKKGQKLTVLSVGSGWSQVSYNGQTGYISNKYWAYR